MRTLNVILFATACLLATQLVSGKLPTIKKASLPCHRLPINATPTKYDLHLKFPSLDSDVYEGRVGIAVNFVKSEASKLRVWGLENVPCVLQHDENTIVLHADKSLEIQDITVTTRSSWSCFPGCKQSKLGIGELIHDEANQMIAIKLKRGIEAPPDGLPATVSIAFKGRMRNDKRGVYLSTYNDGQQVYKHIVSQFQPTDARTVFPCFDEPRFRVPFSVSVSHPKGLTAYGNTEVDEVSKDGDLTRTLFVTTPNMPVHMVAFTIGQFDKPLEVESTRREMDGTERVRKIRVITAPGKRETGHFALEVAKDSLDWFEYYIDYGYPLDKLDVIAIADHDKDNTESWGLVFVRDNLVWIDDETKPDTKITTAVNIAHVVVHQWFGNLISANWWSDLWITEGVAAQFAFKFVEQNYDFQSGYFVRLATLSGVMQADQAGNLHPLSPSEENLQTSDQIYGIFDNLEFMKSGSMAQMIEKSFIEIDSYSEFHYRLALKKADPGSRLQTVNFAQYQSAILSEVYQSTDSRGLQKLLSTFPGYVGVPVLNCQIDSAARAIGLHLESFANASQHIDQPKDSEPIAISITTAFADKKGVKRSGLSKHIVCSSSESCLNSHGLPDWFDLEDATSGHYTKIDSVPSIETYYRTRYSNQLYDRIQDAIERKSIKPMDRLQILDDANSLVQAGLITPDRFKSLLNSYANEDEPGVVLAILVATNTYRGLLPDDVTSLRSNKAILSIFEKYGFEVSGLEDFIMQRARQVVLRTLIQQGNEQVTAAALKTFDEANGNVALFLREPVYTAVVLSGSSDRVDKLLGHLLETKSYEEKVRLVTALKLSKDEKVLTKVKSWLETSGLKA